MRSDINVLIVDDEEVMRNLLKGILEREGYSAEVAADVEEAERILADGSFQIVISDISMPGRDGYSLLKHVKEEYPTIGVILVTGRGDVYSVKDAMILGADEYLTKPFKGFEIAVIVEKVYWRLKSATKV